VEVTFDIDANGILNVAARDKASGKEQQVTITASTNLSKGDIDRMVSEAKRNEAADRRQRELVEARNNADSLAYTAEKALRDLGDRVPAADRQDIERKIQALREALKGDDINRLRQLSDEVQQASYALTQQMQAGAAQGAESGGTAHRPGGDGRGQTEGEGDVVEGEFRET
jgi:molecular chaperone DnaK